MKHTLSDTERHLGKRRQIDAYRGWRLDDSRLLESPQPFIERERSLPSRNESRNRLSSLGDHPLAPALYIAKEFAQSGFRLAHAGGPSQHTCSFCSYARVNLPGRGGMAPSAVLSQTNMNAPNRITSTKTDEIGYNKITIPKMTATVPRNSGTHQCEVIRETPSGLVTDETMLEWYPAAATCLRHGAIACDRQRVSVPRELERASRSGSKLPSSNARATALRSAVVCNVSNAIPVACASSLRTARSSGG